jgi:chorismate synthase
MTLRYMDAGESHGPGLLAILEGLPAGLPLQESVINRELERRQMGYGAGPRMKLERDRGRILAGVMSGVTTGAPLAIHIDNLDHSKWRGKEIEAFTTPRPGHADLTGAVKYGYRDLRPALERASARETAARVAVGAVCRHLLAQFGIQVGGYVVSIGEVRANLGEMDYEERFRRAEESEVRCPDGLAHDAMRARIRDIMTERDTLGGILEVVALNLPVGLGSHVSWDRRLEGRLAAAVMSVQAMKGVEVGPAFENTALPGTQVHDAILLQGENLVRPTNRCGGLEGGMTTGQPLVIRAAMKPIATTLTPQRTVDLETGQENDTTYERSDFCPVPRAVPVLEAVIAFVLADALLEKLGGDSMDEIRPRFEALRQPRLSDLGMDGGSHQFWPASEEGS